MNFPIERIRNDFPQVSSTMNDKPLHYFDNAATTLKPKVMIELMDRYYAHDVANIHRGVYCLSEEGTIRYEEARKFVQNFINAKEAHEIIWTRGTTESINLLANSYGAAFLKEGDEIIISHLEHHSNIVPWQLIGKRYGTKLKVIPINHEGEILIDEYEKLFSKKTKLVAITHVSNSLGTVNPIAKLIKMAHDHNAHIMIDAAQSVAHATLDVQKLDCDFLVFSGHKIYGPNGIGILYGKEELLNQMPPFHGGGDMIDRVTFEETTYNTLPYKFEAGTPPIAEVMGLHESLKYVSAIGLPLIAEYEHELLLYATKKFVEIDGLTIYGTSKDKGPVISFGMRGGHPHDIGTLLDKYGIAIRTGHHCTQPLMNFYKIPGTARASFAIYNTKEEIDYLVSSLKKTQTFF